MAQTERILKMARMLRARGVVSRQQFLKEFEVSTSQFKRDLEFLRDRFQIPIDYDPQRGGYKITGDPAEPTLELPGPIYTSSEVLALLAMQDLISQLQPGLLDQDLAPLRQRL